ncbi:MAG TPA: hypothetical protein DDY31_01350 [Lachnospiraceae bacterium]|nr:hypothetical protein [Lachnospiraceae bacterium]
MRTTRITWINGRKKDGLRLKIKFLQKWWNFFLMEYLEQKENLQLVQEKMTSEQPAVFTRPREVFIRLLLAGASGFVLCHNHPSGDCRPSKADI